MITQNTPEWLEMRKSKIGASDAPIIMKKSPFKTPYQLWQEKLGLVEQDAPNRAMQLGHVNEPKARSILQDKLEIPLIPIVKIHNQRSWMMASIDAMSFDERVMAEIKCPGEKDHNIALAGNIPDKYFPQLQHQMEVCELDSMYYFSFREESTALIKVERDDKYIKSLLQQEEQFWAWMNDFEAPELIDGDFVQCTDDNWMRLVARLQEVKKFQEEEKVIRQELILLANGKNSMGGGIKVSKHMRKGVVDYSAIPQLHDIDLEQYRKKSTEYWRIA